MKKEETEGRKSGETLRKGEKEKEVRKLEKIMLKLRGELMKGDEVERTRRQGRRGWMEESRRKGEKREGIGSGEKEGLLIDMKESGIE